MRHALLSVQHLAAGGRLDMTLLQGLIGHSWLREPRKERYDELADKEDAAYQVGASSCGRSLAAMCIICN